MNSDEYLDFSLSQENTLILPRVSDTPQHEFPVVPRTPKKTRLERLPVNEVTTSLMRIVRGVRVERLHEYFEQACDRRPHETALICGSCKLTYQELDHRANRLAHFLISCGVGEGSQVGILLDRSPDTYIALLGVLKAGVAFVPLDPSFSSDLLAFIAEDAGLCGIVTTSTFREKTSGLPCPVLELDKVYEMISMQPENRLRTRVDPTSLCYIIYTFGSTGRPQGVAVSHANIVNFLRVATPIYGVTRNDLVYQGLSTAFDLSLNEIWPTWIAGATLVAGPTDSQRIDHRLVEFLVKHKITVLYCIPALLATIESDVPSLRTILVVGGACPADLVIHWSRPGRRLLNMYGSPETTVTAIWCELFPGRPVTLGSPLPTYNVYILDDRLRPVEDGEIGEICIGGPGVVIGYLNSPDLTKERFVTNSVLRGREKVPRLYRTGDFGRITPWGEIEWLGQIGTQVKFYHYPIQPGEIGQVAPPQNQATPNECNSAIQFETKAISDFAVETSKIKMLDRINLKKNYKHIMTDPLYKNSILNMASAFVMGVLGFIFWLLIARLYKTENVGIATTLISLMTLLCSFSNLGLSSSIIRYLPRSVNRSEFINSVFAIETISTILVSASFLLGLQIFSQQLLFLRENFLYIISFIAFLIFFSWNTIVDSIFMAFRSASNMLIKNTLISIFKILLSFAFIALGAYGIFSSVTAAFTLGVFVGLIILITKFNIRLSFSVNINLIKETSAYSFANYMTGFMLNAPSLVLPVIILNVLSAEYAAYYYVASMIQGFLQVIPLATTQALLTEGAYNEDELKKHVKKAIVTISAILIPAIGFIVFFGNILLQFFGKNYASQAFQFLQLYSISTIFTSLLLIANAINNVKHRKKTLVISNVIASALTLWLSYAFASGKLVGIGWGWTLGQTIAGLVSMFFIIKVFTA